MNKTETSVLGVWCHNQFYQTMFQCVFVRHSIQKNDARQSDILRNEIRQNDIWQNEIYQSGPL